MPINTTLPDWLATGVQPPDSLRTTGWEEGQKPAAEYFNWFFSTSYYALKDLAEKAASQQDLDNHKNNQSNPHQVTKSQVGLINVDDVKQASKTEFDNHKGATNNPHGVTAAQVGASPTGHGHSTATTTVAGFMSGTDKTKLNAIPPAADVETKSGATQKADDAEAAAINWAKSFGLGGRAETITDGDMNSLDETGFYFLNGAVVNAPTNQPYYVIHMKFSSGYFKQIALSYNGAKTYTRENYGTGWKSWSQIETASGAQAKADAVQDWAKSFGLQQGKSVSVNLDNVIDAGFYFALGTSTNLPNNDPGYLYVSKRQDSTNDYVGQMFIAANNEQLFTRVKKAGSWTAWRQQETTAGAQAKVDATQVHKLTNDDGTALSIASDANTTVKSGMYSTTSSTVNVPSNASGLLIVQERTSGVISQQVIYYSANVMHFRTSVDGGTSWTEWKEFETTAGAQAKADERVKKTGDTMTGALNSKNIRVVDSSRIWHGEVGVFGAFGWTKYEQDGATLDYSSYMAHNAKHNESTGEWVYERSDMRAQLIKVGHQQGFEAWESTDASPAAGDPITWEKKKIETTEGAQAKADDAEAAAIDYAKSFGLGDWGRFTSDANTATSSGFWVADNTTLNMPDDKYYTIFVNRPNSSSVSQIAISRGSGEVGRMYYRSMAGGTWNEWAEVETTAGAQAKADTKVSKSGRDDIAVDNSSGNQKLLGMIASDGSAKYEWYMKQDGTLGLYDRVNAEYIMEIDHTEGTYLWNGSGRTSIASLKQSVSNGKQQVRDAVIGKGGLVADGDGDGIPTFQELTDGVNEITTSPIKSIQRGTVTITGELSKSINISPVNLQKSVVRIVGKAVQGDYDGQSHEIRTKFNTSSSIGFQRDYVSSGKTAYVTYEVIEFADEVNVQSGSFTMTANDQPYSLTISSVDTSKAMLFFSNYDGSSVDTTTSYTMMRGNITNATTVDFSTFTGGFSSEIYVSWFVVELP
ncbi:pyocin knob domain-containing protein [Halobacillus sp. SY10]|uniref:pyocin knob domain-containing protein n=1 Tax=Halobacillus sp. SY10 TaxID=3381356 RepID=UPI003879E36A